MVTVIWYGASLSTLFVWNPLFLPVDMEKSSVHHESQESRVELSQLGDEFSRLLKENRQAIFAHILVLTGNMAVAEDIFQDTSLILFEKFSQFKPGPGFQSWAKQVALHVVLNYRRKKKNHFMLFSEGYFEHLASMSNGYEKEQDRRSDALQGCVQKLKQRDRELVACRYGETVRTIKEVALQVGRPVNTVYKSFQRIRTALLDCIQKTLVQEEQA